MPMRGVSMASEGKCAAAIIKSTHLDSFIDGVLVFELSRGKTGARANLSKVNLPIDGPKAW